MNEHQDVHSPSPEFRASLEREVMQTFLRQSQFETPPSIKRRIRLRTVATLLIGLAVGAGGAVATAQVQESKTRDSLAIENQVKRKLAYLRLELAEAALESAMKSVKVGAISEQGAFNAQADVLTAELAVKRLDLEDEETKLSGTMSRDEMWAPLVGKRDFVMERLHLDAVSVQQKVYAAERVIRDARTRVQVGALQALDTLGPNVLLASAQADLQMIAMKRELRKNYLENKLNEQQLSARVQTLELQAALKILGAQLQEARARSKRANELQIAGTVSVLDAKRAELAELELSEQVRRMSQIIQRMRTMPPPKENH